MRYHIKVDKISLCNYPYPCGLWQRIYPVPTCGQQSLQKGEAEVARLWAVGVDARLVEGDCDQQEVFEYYK